MGRALFAVGAALVLCLAILGVVVYVFRAPEDRIAIDPILSEEITRALALAESRGEDVALSELAPFTWDRVLVVAPRTPPAAITRRLGFEWRGDVNYDEGEVFIFLRGDSVARFANYRGRGAFARIVRPFDELARDDAVFRVRDLVITPARGAPLGR